jgi:hypothetical protein
LLNRIVNLDLEAGHIQGAATALPLARRPPATDRPFCCVRASHLKALERAGCTGVVADSLEDPDSDVADVPAVVAIFEQGQPADGLAEDVPVMGDCHHLAGEVGQRVTVRERESTIKGPGEHPEDVGEVRGGSGLTRSSPAGPAVRLHR